MWPADRSLAILAIGLYRSDCIGTMLIISVETVLVLSASTLTGKCKITFLVWKTSLLTQTLYKTALKSYEVCETKNNISKKGKVALSIPKVSANIIATILLQFTKNNQFDCGIARKQTVQSRRKQNLRWFSTSVCFFIFTKHVFHFIQHSFMDLQTFGFLWPIWIRMKWLTTSHHCYSTQKLQE